MDAKAGYGRMSMTSDTLYRRQTRRRIILLGASAVLLVVLIIAATVAVTVSHKSKDAEAPPEDTTPSNIKTICSVTTYPLQCIASLTSVNGSADLKDPEQLLKLSLIIAMDGLQRLRPLPGKLAANQTDPRTAEALNICTDMIDDSIDHLNDSLALMMPAPGEKTLTDSKITDLRTYLSAVLTNQETCLDGLYNATGGLQQTLSTSMKNSTEFASNCLAIATKLMEVLERLGVPFHRKLLTAEPWYNKAGELPTWVAGDPHRRRLLQGGGAGGAGGAAGFTPDVTVALDGSGQYTTINAAVAAVPMKNGRPFVIYVKAGVYTERVVVPKTKWNVVMIGDGAGKTVITGKRSVNGGSALYNTASIAVEGKGFMARGMTFENTAGPAGEQAVALVVRADQVVIFQCAIIGFQDTLYALSLRQFYRECDIAGTVDFIFGDAAVVFQKCRILPRQPGSGQMNLLTAQGRSDPNSVTGTSIHNCQIAAFDALTARTFLGRPWKDYSRTVYLESDIGGIIDPAGWRSWDGSANAPPSTIFYGEYMNTGPGANTAGRVKWAGYKPALSAEEAQSFSVGSFIQGGAWISNVPFDAAV